MTVTVIGGGASGLMAALTAARAGRRVYLLERQARVGRKLLSTGNGRCNLTNACLSLSNYHGAQADFAWHALEAFGPEVALEFFRSLGLVTATEPDGRVYPLSDQAGSVVDVLRLAADEAGVITKTGFEAAGIEKSGGGFTVFSAEEKISSDKAIVCCGGMAGGKLGGGRGGYELLRSMGHSITKLYPALVQIKTDTALVKALKGVRADALVTLASGSGPIAESRGEVQFTEYGVSGPAIFDISRAASTEKGPLVLRLDLMRSMERPALEEMIARRIAAMPSLTMENLLTGMLHNRLGRTVLRGAGFELAAGIAGLTARDTARVAAAVKDMALAVTGTLGFDGAQVTAGGAKTCEFYPETLESRLVPGLYAAGEVLDIDGDCGGYNLQWAWASGRLAGMTL